MQKLARRKVLQGGAALAVTAVAGAAGIKLAQADQWPRAITPLRADRSHPGPRSFAFRVLGDVYEPEIPKGAYVIIDPDCEPKDDDLVLAKLCFKRWGDSIVLSPYRRKGRNTFGLAVGLAYTRADVAAGHVSILGTARGWLRKV